MLMGEESLASIILAGQNPGRVGFLKEAWEKVFNEWIYWDSFIIGKNKALLPIQKINGDTYTTIDLMLQEQRASRLIDAERILVVGPAEEIKSNIHTRDAVVVEQGKTIGDNFIRTARMMYEEGYDGEFVLLTTGDNPIPTAKEYDMALSGWRKRVKEGIEVYCGVVNKTELGIWILKNKLERYGASAEDYPHPFRYRRNLHKYGFRFKDYNGLIEDEEQPILTYGNFFVVHRDAIERVDAIDKLNQLFGLKRAVIDPRNWADLFRKTGADIVRLVRGKLTIEEMETKIQRYLDVNTRLFLIPEEFALDIDFKVDWKRAIAYIGHNLENYAISEIKDK